MNTENHEIMSTILLSGSLAKIFGRSHPRIISTTREALTALTATIPGFQNFMNTSKARGLTFAVFVDKKNVSQDDLDFPNRNRTIRIVPVIIGSKKAGILQTIMGAALVAVGAIATFGFGQTWGVNVMVAGGSMVAGGVIQMLSPQTAGLASKQGADNKASYAFGGVTNTAAQVYPVPLLYGKRRIGGAIISAGIYVEDKL